LSKRGYNIIIPLEGVHSRRSCKGFIGWVDNLINGTNEEEYVMIEVCPDGCISGSGSDITLNRWDMRSKFGYAILSKIARMKE